MPHEKKPRSHLLRNLAIGAGVAGTVGLGVLVARALKSRAAGNAVAKQMSKFEGGATGRGRSHAQAARDEARGIKDVTFKMKDAFHAGFLSELDKSALTQGWIADRAMRGVLSRGYKAPMGMFEGLRETIVPKGKGLLERRASTKLRIKEMQEYFPKKK